MSRKYQVEGELNLVEVPETPAPGASALVRRITAGEYDHALEEILEAAHHRKRELRRHRVY